MGRGQHIQKWDSVEGIRGPCIQKQTMPGEKGSQHIQLYVQKGTIPGAKWSTHPKTGHEKVQMSKKGQLGGKKWSVQPKTGQEGVHVSKKG